MIGNMCHFKRLDDSDVALSTYVAKEIVTALDNVHYDWMDRGDDDY